MKDHVACRAAVAELPDDPPSANSREKQLDAAKNTLRSALEDADRAEFAMAEVLHKIHAESYWDDWGYPSFREFIRHEFPFGQRKAELLIGIYQKFRVELGLPPERLGNLEWSKAALVTSVISHDNVDELLRDVKEMSSSELRRKVRQMRAVPATAEERKPEPSPTPTAPLKTVAAVADNWRRPRPPEHEFYVPAEVWDQACFAFGRGKALLFKGPSGSGKSELCYLLARTFGRTIEPFNFGAMSEARSALIGNTHFDRAKGTWFQASRFIRAITTSGAVVLLDEISRCQRDTFNILLTLLDTQGYLSLDESEEASRVYRAPGVTFVATANFGDEFTGADEMDNALAQRFAIHVPMEFPPPAQETRILTTRCPKLDHATANRLVRFAVRQREMAREGEFTTTVSTRMLIEAAEQVEAGLPLQNAVGFCVLTHFSDDGGEQSERTKLQQVFQKG